uniref:Uncharacterized protein n=1 Tax=Romanomermis culicivorax TaxID=13658 RepID=A0A915L362_ROMCU
GTVLINSAQELLNYGKGEEEIVENQVKSLHESGVNCVVSGGKFGDLYLHFLNKYNMMAIRLTSKFDIRRLCKTIGATPQPKIHTPNVEEIGHCDHVYLDEVGDTDVVVFKLGISKRLEADEFLKRQKNYKTTQASQRLVKNIDKQEFIKN